MKTFHFNTGVKPYANPYLLENGGVVKGGTIQIPFDCDDVPENATLKFCCGEPNMTAPNLICREVYNTKMIAKYAYFVV